MRLVCQDAWESGAFPLWDSFAQGGQALVGSPVAALFYPFNWLSLWGPWEGFFCYAIGHYFLLGFAAYAMLAVGFRLPVLAAVAGALSLSLSGYLASMFFSIHFTTAGWLLLTSALWLRALRTGARAAWPAGLCLALAFTAGFLQEVLMALVGLLALSVCWCWRGRPQIRWKRAISVTAVVGIISGVLCAVPLYYILRSHQDSTRSLGLQLAEVLTWSTHPIRLAELAFPYLWGTPHPGDPYVGHIILKTLGTDHAVEWAPAISLGGLFFCLLWFPVRPARRALHRLLWVGFLGSIVLALGKYSLVYATVLEAIPPLAVFRYPQKWLLAATVLSAVIVGLKMEALLHRPASRYSARLVCGVAPVALAGVLLGWFQGRLLEGLTMRTVQSVCLLLLVAGAVWAVARTSRSRIAIVALGLVCSLDWCRTAWSRPIADALPDPLVAAHSAMAEALRSIYDPQYRVHVESVLAEGRKLPNQPASVVRLITGSLKDASPAIWSMRTTGGIHPNATSRWMLLRRVLREDPEKFWEVTGSRYLLLPEGRVGSLPVLACSEDQGVSLVEFERAQPRIRLLQRWVCVGDSYTAARELAAAPRSFLATSGLLETTTAAPEQLAQAELVVREDRPGLIACTVSTDSTVLLHVGENLASGWRATINGERTEIVPVNLSFMGVLVPPGTHKVSLQFGW